MLETPSTALTTRALETHEMAAKLIHRELVGAYVYALLVDGVVRYIGKGRRYRVLEHFRIVEGLNALRASGRKVKAQLVHNKLAKAVRENAEVTYIILVHGLSDAAAYEIERREIAAATPGSLWNIKQGGSGGDADMMRRLWADPDFRERCSSGIRAGKRKPHLREKVRKRSIEQWSDPDFRERWLENHRAKWDDPEEAAARKAALKSVWADKHSSKELVRVAVKAAWTPERRAAMAANRAAAWADPEFSARVRAKIAATRATQASRQKISAAARVGWTKRKRVEPSSGAHRNQLCLLLDTS